ncbi:MAG: CRISPR-associated endonuclease Cas2 [Bacteroidia bacterium]|jgi:CRISPR-associated protein Cas2|nr:CRISPR-associated endonuclease Cas2 [Bacteroidia bacterium]
MSIKRLSAYRIMWIFVFFDLPTATKKDRHNYARFRRKLQDDGFVMMQFSVYRRFCASGENADVHTKRVFQFLPPKGQISIMRVTDKQYSEIKHFIGKSAQPVPNSPQQLELF